MKKFWKKIAVFLLANILMTFNAYALIIQKCIIQIVLKNRRFYCPKR